MGQSIAVNEARKFTPKFSIGDHVEVVDNPWMLGQKSYGTVWQIVKSRSAYLVKHESGKLLGWREEQLRITIRGRARRAVWTVQAALFAIRRTIARIWRR